MGNQKSEMQDKYTAKPDKITQLLTQSPDSIVDVTLSDHHKEGPTKVMQSNSKLDLVDLLVIVICC